MPRSMARKYRASRFLGSRSFMDVFTFLRRNLPLFINTKCNCNSHVMGRVSSPMKGHAQSHSHFRLSRHLLDTQWTANEPTMANHLAALGSAQKFPWKTSLPRLGPARKSRSRDVRELAPEYWLKLILVCRTRGPEYRYYYAK